MRIASLQVIDRRPVERPWGGQLLSVPGALVPTGASGSIGIGAYIEVAIEPHDDAARLDLWVYVRPLDGALQVIDEVSDLLHLIDCQEVAPVGQVAERVFQPLIVWVPSYPVGRPLQLWFEARLDDVPEAERAVSLVPDI